MTVGHALALGLAGVLAAAGAEAEQALESLAPLELVADGLPQLGGIAVDGDDRVYVADRTHGQILRIGRDGSRTVLAGGLGRPLGVVLDAAGRVLVTEESAGRVVRIEGAASVVLAAGLQRPGWIDVGEDGTVYVTTAGPETQGEDEQAEDETASGAIVAIAADGTMRVVADALPGLEGIAVNGTVIYAAVRSVGSRSAVRRFDLASTGGSDWVGPLEAVARPRALARDRLGALWLALGEADSAGSTAREAMAKLDAGAVSTFASGLGDPQGVAFSLDGDLYMTDGHGGRVLRFLAPARPRFATLPDVTSATALLMRGSAEPGARIDLFVNDATAATRAIAGPDGGFEAVVVLAENTESRVEALATAAGGQGLTSAPTVVLVSHDGEEPDLVFLRPDPGAFVAGTVLVEARARDAGSGVAQLTLSAGGETLAAEVEPPPPALEIAGHAGWDTRGRPDGTAAVAATAVDRAGRTRQAAHTVIVDNTPPSVVIVAGPSGESPITSATFVFEGQDNLTPPAALRFAWRLDDAPYGAWVEATTASLSALAPGAHVFEVKARDGAGNQTATPARRAFAVLAGPAITAVTPAAAAVGATVTISGAGLDPGPVAIAFNGIAASVRSATPTTVVASVPPGATSGPLTLETPRGIARHPFEVLREQDIALSARPAALRAVAGLPATVTLALDSVGVRPFTGLARLAIRDAGPHSVQLDAGALTGGQRTILTITPAPEAVGTVTLHVEATASIDGAVVAREVTVAVEVLPGDRTAVAGRLALVDDTPVSGAQVTLAGTAQRTDEGGNFVFVDPPPGRQMLGVDANVARAGLPIYAIDVDLPAGRPTRLPPLRITPPPPAERFVAIDNATRDQVVTDDRFPGFALTLPAGSVIVGWDGVVKQRVAVERLTPDALPVPPPPFATASFYQVFFGTPMGGLPSVPLPVSLPNDQDLAPGERAEIWYYDAAPIPGATAGWRLAGPATVAADGRRVVSDPGLGLARFCGVCGIACIRRTTSAQPNVDGHGVRAGDPVDLATGLMLLHKTDLFLPARVPAVLHRVHNPVDPFGGVAGFALTTGPGWALSVDAVLLDDGPDARVLIMPGNSRLRFARGPDGTFTSAAAPDLAGAVLTPLPDGGHRLAFRDGTAWRFATGWRARGRLAVLTGLGLLVEQRNRHGQALVIDRDGHGAVASISEPAGRTLTFSTTFLDPAEPTSARLTAVVDPLGRTVAYGYDADGRLSTVTDAAGGVTRYTYAATGGVASITDPRGITYLAMEYDGAGRVVRQRQADGGLWHFAYDGPVHAHTRVAVTDPRGATTTHVLHAGRAAATTDAQGQTVRIERDPAGRAVAVLDGLGRAVRLTHDANGDVVAVTGPGGATRQFTYAAGGRMQSMRDELGGFTRLDYDAAGRLEAATDAAGTRVGLQVDSLGQLSALTDALGNTTRLEYARTGELVAVTDPLGHRISLEYDGAARLVRRTDAAGRTVRLWWDALDRLVQVIDASGVTRYEYDPNGNLVAVTDPLGRSVRYAYDAMDRRVSATDALGQTETYAYDPGGLLVRHVDRAGRVTEHEHDALGRRVLSRYADGAVDRLTYDAAGRLASGGAGSTQILFEYDDADRLLAETTAFGTTRYTWDARGRRTSMTAPDGRTVTTEFDAASRPSRISRADETAALEYDAAGRLARLELPGGVLAEYAYDAAARVTTLAWSQRGRSLGALAYRYDPDGRRREMTGSLARVRLPAPVADALYDDANRQRRFGDRSMTYDARGNLTTLLGPDRSLRFTWDSQDRLVAVSDGVTERRFTYDALDRRIARRTDGEDTVFLNDLTDVVEDVGPASVVAYLRGPGPDWLLAAGGRAVVADGLGSVLAVVDGDGITSETLEYEPFGRTVPSEGALRFGFTGRERESDDLYYYRARYYHAGLARFISEDPLGPAAGGLNRYAYAENDPVNSSDPSGLRTYVLHGVWPNRAAFEEFGAALRAADPQTHLVSWTGDVFGGVVPSARRTADLAMGQILDDLASTPLGPEERLNLVGFSGGGLVAIKTADLLRARGVKVDTIITMGTPSQSFTTGVSMSTRVVNFVGVMDPLSSLWLGPTRTNHFILAGHTARSYTEHPFVLAAIRRELRR